MVLTVATVLFVLLLRAIGRLADAMLVRARVPQDALSADSKNVSQDMADLCEEVRMLGAELARLKPGPMEVSREIANVHRDLTFPAANLAGVDVSAFGTAPTEKPAAIHHVGMTTPAPVDGLDEERELAIIAKLEGPQKTMRLNVLTAKKSCGPVACCKCVYWDLENGQAELAQYPVFMAAARHALPNRMGTPVLVDEDGDKLPDALQPPPMVPAKLNKWELFGVCAQDNAAHHAIDKCPSFKATTALQGASV